MDLDSWVPCRRVFFVFWFFAHWLLLLGVRPKGNRSLVDHLRAVFTPYSGRLRRGPRVNELGQHGKPKENRATQGAANPKTGGFVPQAMSWSVSCESASCASSGTATSRLGPSRCSVLAADQNRVPASPESWRRGSRAHMCTGASLLPSGKDPGGIRSRLLSCIPHWKQQSRQRRASGVG